VADVVVGLLHPGQMGAAVGAALRSRGVPVLWASEGRSPETARRADEAGLDDVRTVSEVARRADVVVSVCPPHAARAVAAAVAPFQGTYVDANAVSPATARAVAAEIDGDFVDGGIVGPPPTGTETTRLYLSGARAEAIAGLFAATSVDARVLSDRIGDASALKMVYAAATKGHAALLLATRAAARAHGVEEALLDEWRLSLPEHEAESLAAARSAAAKGWRWIGEMEEIAATFGAAGLPEGFHLAAAEIFRGTPPAGGTAPLQSPP
jgi:3-hydroxyisobutyrate dehydrogenase-like beta-hydroxyacid dehydrogenase